MIRTVGVKNLMFHFYNDLLFLRFTAWIVKEAKEFEFQYFPSSTTTLGRMQDSFQTILYFKYFSDLKSNMWKLFFPIVTAYYSLGNIKHYFWKSKWEIWGHKLNVHCPDVQESSRWGPCLYSSQQSKPWDILSKGQMWSHPHNSLSLSIEKSLSYLLTFSFSMKRLKSSKGLWWSPGL